MGMTFASLQSSGTSPGCNDFLNSSVTNLQYRSRATSRVGCETRTCVMRAKRVQLPHSLASIAFHVCYTRTFARGEDSGIQNTRQPFLYFRAAASLSSCISMSLFNVRHGVEVRGHRLLLAT